MNRDNRTQPASRKGFLAMTVAAAALCALAGAAPALADDAAPAADAPPPGLKISGMIEAGIYGNTAQTDSGVNGGQLFTDKHDQVVLNQAMMTAQKDLDPKAEGFDWGFKLQGFYGADARYTHFIGLFDHSTTDRNQFDITEANLLGHLPVLTEGGIDVKVGGYSTPLGYEVIQASSNPLYSHSYIFNYALPLKHTGALTTTHVNSLLDVYIGADTGINDTFSQRGNPSGGTSALLGFGLNNMMDGKLTILALSHVGPADAELRTTQPNGSALGASHHGKYINDVTATYKPDDVWTWVTEVNYTRDDLLNNKAFGIAQYGTYAVNSWLSVTGRGEIFADPNNAYVTNFRGNGDFVDSERGTTQQYSTLSPNTTGKGANYVALTLGASIKLPDAPALIDGAMLRPEIRWDHTMNGANAFNYDNTGVARDAGQLSIGMDMIVPLNF